MPSTNTLLFQLPHNEVEDFTVQLGFSDSDNSVSSYGHRISELKRQLAAVIHVATTFTNNCSKSTAINTSAATTIPVNIATTQGKDKVTDRIHQLAEKFTILHVLWIRNIEELFKTTMDPKYQLVHRFNSSPDVTTIGLQTHISKLKWVQNGEIYYEPFAPILHHNYHGKIDIYKLFLNLVLIQVYKSIVHNQGSLDQPNYLTGGQGGRWGISEIAPGAIAMTRICAHFSLSHDPQFQHQGSVLCIDYEMDFQTYLEFLLVDNSIVKNIFSFWNQEIYSRATINTTFTSQRPQSSAKAVLAELKSASLQPVPLSMAIVDPFSTPPLPSINPL
ncbi:hypothetical protein BU17DRAFT_65025 [Hysterangium stoloniferum]|nr:hypothetical protein BU17DRAFT_65025 [Hysterangium stoloniferum]